MLAPSRKSFFVLAALLVCAAAVIGYVSLSRRSEQPGPDGALSERQLQSLASQLTALKEKEQQVAKTVWKKELQAQEHGYVFEELWDALNGTTNKLALAATVPVREVVPPRFDQAQELAHQIKQYRSAASGPTWRTEQWQGFLKDMQAKGWELVQCEFRHNQFQLDTKDQPSQSRFYFSAHLINARQNERAILEGDLTVHWEVAPPTGKPAVKVIDASSLALKTRQGEPAFQLILNEQVAPFEGSHFIDPLLVYDLDGDGLSEIILGGRNLVFRRGQDGTYRSEPLCQHSPGLPFTGIVADFDGAGAADFLCAKFEGLFLFKGTERGTFDDPDRPVWKANPKLKYAQVLTCGDIDGDGDLDVWLGQYKLPYERGQMPTPYFDANDGHASYLLVNDGRGNFADATDGSGLVRKRWRRCYSASFADLDSDGDLDLAVVSDFAGIDIYANDGKGHFTDATRDWIDEPHAFGMAHALADFNADGRLDLLMIGMNSPTAERLENLGLKRHGFEERDAMRARMIYGNRLYLAQADGAGFTRTALNDWIARTGWSWGCSAFDFDNDSLNDVYIANGHVSRPSVRDHEPEFWLHDIYVANSRDSIVAHAYMAEKFTGSRDQGYSYGGYEKNRLFWNQRGASFLELAHLFGVALETDSRNVVADDLDGDGRVDLLLTTLEVWPVQRQTVRVFRNILPDTGNWIGFRIREEGGGVSPVGARITLHRTGGSAERQMITGDSYRSQHPNTVHFGLGAVTSVDSAEIRWPNGRTEVIKNPALNRYHSVGRTRNPDQRKQR